MKNILFFFSNTLIGGAETNILKISSELNKLGYKVHFATLEDNGPLFLNFSDFHFETFTEIGRYEISPLNSLKKYKQLLESSKIDIVSSFGLRVELFVRITSKLISPHVKIISNIRASENWRKWYHVFLDKVTKSNVDIWVSNSRSAMLTFVKREGINANKVEVIYNFIDLKKHNNLYKPSVRFNIGVFANYKLIKGHFNLIPIAKKLKFLGIEFKILCAGHDYTRGKFKEKILENGLENEILLLGHILDKDCFFHDIDLFFLPSYIEGISTSMIEAMSYGVPVIVSNVDGMPEAVENGVNGFIRDPDDLDGFVNDIINLQDISLRKKFIEESLFVLINKFDKSNNMKLWVNLIEKI